MENDKYQSFFDDEYNTEELFFPSEIAQLQEIITKMETETEAPSKEEIFQNKFSVDEKVQNELAAKDFPNKPSEPNCTAEWLRLDSSSSHQEKPHVIINKQPAFEDMEMEWDSIINSSECSSDKNWTPVNTDNYDWIQAWEDWINEPNEIEE